ncbi:hypothetical protein COPG_00145 [Colwellia phage 9A]|uniref:Uncharacterized protein n=1 Tax=Colwellia phage 9A TaxID=765765 RepID=I3UMM6_9CAUD|nr:hypothetical protein COPG_00145 [Colwellia phage 9A]AFK66741.1 hypothetical protein COPG_00145 [Colwellia phage 9A]
MSQVTNINDQIAKLEAEKVELLAAQDSAANKDHWLSDAMPKFDHLVHNSTLYGQIYNISFKVTKELIDYILELDHDNVLNLVDSTKGSGCYTYQQLPLTDHAKNEILARDNTAKFGGQFEAIETVKCKGYVLDFYTQTKDGTVAITLDFSHLITAENYSTMSKGNELPHFVENDNYTKDGKHGSEFFGKNGGNSHNCRLGYKGHIDSLVFALVELGVK